MSQVRLGATCLLVRAMFRNGQVRQAQMQGMRWKGDDHSLPECSLTQAEAFSDLDDLHPSGSLRVSRRRSPTSRRHPIPVFGYTVTRPLQTGRWKRVRQLASDACLIVVPSTFMTTHRELVIGLAAKRNIPAIYGFGYYAQDGGLVSYGFDVRDIFMRAASYVDRILRGTHPADLPVLQPTKFELALNVKTAKALGLEIPPTLLARADEVFE
jgi:ABC transporter substrate binding protein